MRALTAILSAVAVAVLATPAHVQAQPRSPTEQVRAMAEWGALFQGVVAEMVAVIDRIPAPPDENMDAAARRAWAANARGWAQEAQGALAGLEARAVQLPPPPAAVSAEHEAALSESRARLPDAVRAASSIAASYLEMADAFERGRGDAVRRIRVDAVEASLLMMGLFHDINKSQAMAIERSHPQHSLLMSYARSYEGLIALMAFKRDVMREAPTDRSAVAAALYGAADEMRVQAAAGRAAAAAMQRQLADPSRFSPAEAPLIEPLRAMLQTYEGSFDREAAMAAQLRDMADLMRDPRAFADIEPALDQHMMVFSELDSQRVVDAQRRQAVLAQP
jgi:hypothetical protein